MATEEKGSVAPETHAFEAEVRQILDIVIHSLYTDREIFLRELISNSVDALEKARHELLVNPDLPEKETPLKVEVSVDQDAKTVTVSDSGIGMTHDDLVENLGTIAHSGTRQFLAEALKAAKGNEPTLIGQFGVGFYSAFMVANKVVVDTKAHHADSQPVRWESDGGGEYTIGPSDRNTRGTTVTIHLAESAEEFADSTRLKGIIRRFSSFVPFPVEMDGERVNTVQALWTRNKNEISDEEYTEFYKFIANAHEEPKFRLHFSADAPLAINALLFVPERNFEFMGLGRMEPGVDLYCRKILIQKHPEKLLPEWMRFVRGVIDSDDLPLNISRETMQDSALIRKLAKVITNRFLRFLNDESNRDPEKYRGFFQEFGRFIKEGITTDFEYQEQLAKLLRFETSKTNPGELTSLADYVSRMKDGQEDIIYISGPSREAIEVGPYVEALLEHGYEVIYNFDQIDDFVFNHLGEFEGKKLKSADSSDLNVPELEKKDDQEELTSEQADELCGWIKKELGERVGSVRTSKRLVNNPAVVVTEGMTASMQRLMSAMNQGEGPMAQTLTMEVNPRHALVRKLYTLKGENEDFARELADQLFDNAMIAAGLLTDPRGMVDRLNKMLTKAAGA